MKLQKIWILICSVFFSIPAYSGETVLRCVTSQPTTSYIITDEEDHYNLHIYHHNGVDFMPIHSGVVTPYWLPRLMKQAEELKKIGTHAVVQFSKEECTNNGIYWRCFHHQPVLLGKLKVEKVGFAMGKLSSNYEGMEWVSTETFLHLQIDRENISLPLSFPEGNCRE